MYLTYRDDLQRLIQFQQSKTTNNLRGERVINKINL